MIQQMLLFVLISLVVGLVNLTLGQPTQRSAARELLGYALVVIGGIAAFTAAIVVIAALFQ